MIIKQEVSLAITKYNNEPSIISHVPDDDYFTVLATKEIEVEFDMPTDIEIRDMKIAKLKKQRKNLQADTQVQVEQINVAIQSLMALEVSA